MEKTEKGGLSSQSSGVFCKLFSNSRNKLSLQKGQKKDVHVCVFMYSYQWFMILQAPGRRSRTTSESSTHSAGRERSNSAVKQASPPPPSIPEQPRKEEAKKVKKDSPKKVHIY